VHAGRLVAIGGAGLPLVLDEVMGWIHARAVVPPLPPPFDTVTVDDVDTGVYAAMIASVPVG